MERAISFAGRSWSTLWAPADAIHRLECEVRSLPRQAQGWRRSVSQYTSWEVLVSLGMIPLPFTSSTIIDYIE